MSSLNPKEETKSYEKIYSLVLSYIICIMQATGQNKLLCLILIFMLYEKQTAKHFLKLKKFKNLGIPGKL